jgi:feruloyl esterase
VTITSAHVEAAETDSGAEPPLPEHCSVTGTSRPTPDSAIGFEVDVPVGAGWNGRYLQVGNGVFAGRIPDQFIAPGLAAGYAVAGTDDGHQTGNNVRDASWALGHPEKVIDFGYRALKETTDAARAVIRAYTGRAPAHSYFQGCSTGGREALTEAQRYPEDFDGIVVGAPATGWAHLFFGKVWNEDGLLETPASYIPSSELRAIQAAAAKACGDADGVIEDPLACHFDPAVLRCAGAETNECLIEAQIKALRRIYEGPKNSRTGEPIAPGLEPGAESSWGGPKSFIAASATDASATATAVATSGFFRFLVFDDPAFDVRRLNFDGDVAKTDAKVGAILDGTSSDLSAFRARGGKLVHYQGWSDESVPPRQSIAYYERVRAKMGDTSDFYRLFMTPGMLHCGHAGGPGPTTLAALEAVVRWVEEGKAPERIVATKYVDDDPAKPVARTRPVCPYPQRAVRSGAGDRNREDAYRCQ